MGFHMGIAEIMREVRKLPDDELLALAAQIDEEAARAVDHRLIRDTAYETTTTKPRGMTGIFSKNGVSLDRLQSLEKVVRAGSITRVAQGEWTSFPQAADEKLTPPLTGFHPPMPGLSR